MRASRANALAWLGLSLVWVLADQFTKHLVRASLQLGEVRPVIGHFFNWTLVYNTGAAFSFLAGRGGWQRWLFIALAVAIALALVVWLARTRRSDWRTALPLALIVGGAVGNLIDRVVLGRVTDFVLVYLGNWAYPAFNVADVGVSVGAVLLIAFSLFEPREARA